jgi:hypothetical protein
LLFPTSFQIFLFLFFLPATRSILPVANCYLPHINPIQQVLPMFPKLFVLLPLFCNSSFLVFNILDVFASPLQRSLSGLTSCFLQSAIHCRNFTNVIYIAFHRNEKY